MKQSNQIIILLLVLGFSSLGILVGMKLSEAPRAISTVNKGSEEVAYYLPVGAQPNDYTWQALDCNKPLRVIDSNGIEFAVIPKPFIGEVNDMNAPQTEIHKLFNSILFGKNNPECIMFVDNAGVFRVEGDLDIGAKKFFEEYIKPMIDEYKENEK